jgi:hypothetical protein
MLTAKIESVRVIDTDDVVTVMARCTPEAQQAENPGVPLARSADQRLWCGSVEALSTRAVSQAISGSPNRTLSTSTGVGHLPSRATTRR